MYQRIRDLRTDRDRTQKDLAKYLNCSQAAYSRYELGRQDIPPEVLVKMAVFYNTSIDYLLDRTDDCRPYPRSKKSLLLEEKVSRQSRDG